MQNKFLKIFTAKKLKIRGKFHKITKNQGKTVDIYKVLFHWAIIALSKYDEGWAAELALLHTSSLSCFNFCCSPSLTFNIHKSYSINKDPCLSQFSLSLSPHKALDVYIKWFFIIEKYLSTFGGSRRGEEEKGDDDDDVDMFCVLK